MAALLTAFSVRMEVAASLTLNPIKDAAKVQGPGQSPARVSSRFFSSTAVRKLRPSLGLSPYE
jgi:hypothetical protein